jgi:hypothetical protein
MSSYRLRYWEFFVTIDEDLHELSRFVEFHPDNFKTFSAQLLRLYLAVGSEVDVVAKLLCLQIDSTKKPDNIKGYQEIITSASPSRSALKASVGSVKGALSSNFSIAGLILGCASACSVVPTARNRES